MTTATAQIVPFAKEPPFARVSPACARAKIRGESLRLYIALASFADRDGWCWPGSAALARRSDVKPQHHSRALCQLVGAGLIKIISHPRGNRYQILGITTNGEAITTDGEAITTDGEAITTGGSRAKKKNKSQEQINNQIDEQTLASASVNARTRDKRHQQKVDKALLPEDWQPSEADRDFAIRCGYGPNWIAEATEVFRDLHLGDGTLMADPSAYWRRFVRRADEFGPFTQEHEEPSPAKAAPGFANEQLPQPDPRLRQLIERVGQVAYDHWFVGGRVDWRSGACVLFVPTRFKRDWIRRSYQADLADIFGQSVAIEVGE